MVKELNAYQCEICGKTYKEAEEAFDCERACKKLITITIKADRTDLNQIDIDVLSAQEPTYSDTISILETAIFKLKNEMLKEKEQKEKNLSQKPEDLGFQIGSPEEKKPDPAQK